MQIIEKDIYREINYAKYFNDNKVCFIDIETTGLSRNYNSIYLIGILHFTGIKNKWNLTQLFAESIKEEKDVLLYFIKLIKDYDKIVTYNGESFDIPFINQRLQNLDLSYVISNDKSLDLYRKVKDNRYYLNIENLKLKSLEKYLGLYREDIYSGKDCIQFYLDYVKTNDITLKEKVLQHNYDDLYYMTDVLRILDIIKDKKSFSIDYDDNYIDLLIDSVNILGDQIIIKGKVEENKIIKLIHYDNNYKISFDNCYQFEVAIEYSVGLVSPTEKGFFIDKNKLALSSNIIDSTSYNLPNNMLLLNVEKEYCIENIKMLIQNIISSALESSNYAL